MREVRRHRLDRGARVALWAGALSLVWVAAVAILGTSSDARADDGIDTGMTLPPIPIDVPTLAPIPEPLRPLVDTVTDLVDDVDLPAVPELPTLPVVPATPALPAPTVPPVILLTPSTSGESPLGTDPDGRTGSVDRDSSTTRPDRDPSRDIPWTSPWSLGATPVTPPATPAPPTPAQIASASASVLAPPPADRTSSPRAHFASFPEVAPPERGPPSDHADDMDPSPD